MCVVSMVMDHYSEKWLELQKPIQWPPFVFPPPAPTLPTQAEVDEFHALLKRAREYDRKHNEPDCELQEKKQKLLEIARDMGLKLNLETVESAP